MEQGNTVESAGLHILCSQILIAIVCISCLICIQAQKDGVCLSSLSDNKILSLSKLKAFADAKLNVTQNIKVVFLRIDNIVGKEENAVYRHFLLFPQCFQKALSSSVSEVVIVW